MRKRKNRRRLAVVVAVLALTLIMLGVISNEKTTVQTGTDTQGHLNYGYAGSTSRETATENRTAGTSKKRTDVEAISVGDRATESEAPTTSVPAESVHNRNTIYVCVSYGAGPGDTLDVNVNPAIDYYTAEVLEKGLLYDLKPYATAFIQAQEMYHIDAVFLAAVAAEESGYGRYTFRKNNIFGYGTKDFDSVPQCIDYVASKLRDNYLTPEGIYFEGCGVAEIAIHYNNGSETWIRNVTQIMYDITSRIERTDT